MNFKAYVAEFVGTFALIFVGVGAIAADHITSGASGLVGIALAHGLTIAVMASATGAISGGHLNPAVTIGCLATGKIQAGNALGYILAQCTGALAAAGTLTLCLPAAPLRAVQMGTPALGEGIGVGMGLITEFILTFLLVFVIFGTAFDSRAPKVGGLFIGMAVTIDVLMGAPISGAAMNPARHFGPAVLGGGLQHLWLYWVGPVAGGLAAALVYHHTLEES